MDGATETLFSGAPSGTEAAPWIQPGHSYDFSLYQNTDHSKRVATATVLGVAPNGGTISAFPRTVSGTPVGTTTVTWATADLSTAQVWVSMDGAAETLFSGESSGSVAAPWIQAGHRYEFKLYEGTAHSKPFSRVGVTGNGGIVDPPPVLEVGGSNYVLWDASAYLANPTLSTWYAPLALKPVIGTYHLGPTTVQAQLKDMWNHGQRQITLELFYAPFDAATDGDGDGVYGHVVDSSQFKLREQHRKNLIALLADIRATGFQKVYFRFCPQGDMMPWDWPAWDEAKFDQAWNFIYNTRVTVDAEMANSGIKVIYDLSGELGGVTEGQAKPFAKKLWQYFSYRFGNQDTYGYSFAVAPGRLKSMIATYDEAGHGRPSMYAFDLYGTGVDEGMELGYLAQELAAAGESNKPIIVQETYYNDALANARIRQAAAENHLKLVAIFQWPWARGATFPHFSVNYPAEYAAYLAP